MREASVSSRERNLGVQRDNLTDLGEGDHLIRLVLADFTGQPLRKLQLDHGWHQPVGLLRQTLRERLPGG